jgi:hypothetical protein
MKMMILGVELSAGVSKKNGQAYSIGQLHTATQLAPSRGEGNIAKGFVGASYECPGEVLQKVAKLPFPVHAEVELLQQVRYGKLQSLVVDVVPGTIVRSESKEVRA